MDAGIAPCSLTADPEPFELRQPNPDFAIIIFLGGDNDLTGTVPIHLDQMEQGTAGGIAVLAVTDQSDAPARVMEVSGGRRSVVQDLGEINTGDVGILADLLARALVSYPPETRLAIGFQDHGSGIFDEAVAAVLRQTFFAAQTRTERFTGALSSGKLFLSLRGYEVLIDQKSGDMLTTREAGLVLRDAFAAAGRTEKVELIFSDACLNGMIEVVTELAPFAHCIIASEEVEPSSGWDYSKWLSAMALTPRASAEIWACQALEAMDEAYGGRLMEFPKVTLSAIRSDNGVARAFADLVAIARPFGQAGFTQLDQACKSTQILGRRIDCFDLGAFARKLVQTCSIPEITAAANALQSAITDAVVGSLALGDVADMYGISFWFPGGRESMERTATTYGDLRFEALTGWLAYLRAFR